MDVEQFKIREGAKVDLNEHPTDFTDNLSDKDAAREPLKQNIQRLSDLQDTLYAQNIYSLLIVLQAMDAAGKDSVVKHVMSGVNPEGCQVTSFKAPSAEELDHDFLWRCQVALPERGKIGIFNRSQYEEVLVVRVHPEILEAEQLPDDVKHSSDIWEQRYRQIRNWEDALFENGIHVVKFFLHVSKDEQKKRFLARIDQPDKNWKFSSRDVKERGHWDDYMQAYVDAIEATSTEKAPWYIIPADKKWFTRLSVSKVIVQKLESMGLAYPKLSGAGLADLEESKKLRQSEKT
ncbi:MAG TPA: polyphosphate kinase 2 family protein [Pyrinomonadaceae bacterium]